MENFAPKDGPCLVLFRTTPDEVNSNASIEAWVMRAAKRRLPSWRIVRADARRALAAIEATRPTLAIGVGGLAPDALDFSAMRRATRTAGAALAYWVLEDPYEFDFSWKISGLCDWIFTTDQGCVDHYDSPNVSHLPLAASLDDHFRPLRPFTERSIDAFFCGVAYPNRAEIAHRLRNVLGRHKAEFRGTCWDEALPFCRNVRMTPGELSDAYASARIVLNLGRTHDIANRRYEIVASTPGPRTFEAAAAGCVQAAFTDMIGAIDYYDLGAELLMFGSVSEFASILERACDDPSAFDKIAAAAQVRTRENHTYDHRVATLLSTLGDAMLIDCNQTPIEAMA